MGEGSTTTTMMAPMKIVSNSPHKLMQPDLEIAVSKNEKSILAKAFKLQTSALILALFSDFTNSFSFV